jgi:hypothetical protein
MKYYLLLNSEIKGPFLLAMVREMHAAGAIENTTLIAPEGGSNWSAVGSLLAETADIPNSTIKEGGASPILPDDVRKWLRNRKVQVAAAVIVGIVFFTHQNSDNPESRNRASYNERSSDLGSTKKKANIGAYNLYMQGYNDPKQAEVAEIMLRGASGDDATGYAIMALGGKDRKAGLPPRFELDRSLD